MPYKSISRFFKKVAVFFIAIVTIFGVTNPFLFLPKIVFAQDTVPPNINHWSAWQADGDAVVTTTLYVHAFVGDNTATPGSTLVVSALSKSAGWGGFSSSTCYAEYSDTNQFRCPIGIQGGSDARTFNYYLEAFDGENKSWRSWATDTNSLNNAKNYPFQTTVYNAPSWTNGISAEVTDGRHYNFSRGIQVATSTLYISSTTDSTANLAVNDWIILKSTTGASEPKVKILAINGFGQTATEYEVQISGYTPHNFTTSDYVNEFVDNALVFIDGTTAYATTTAVQATTTFGAISLYNVPNGSFDVTAFKQGYTEHRITNVYLSGTSTSTLRFVLPFGGFQGGANLGGTSVSWSAPSNGMTGAPANIGIAQQPILVAFSGNASSTTISKNNITLKVANPDGTFTAFSGYYNVAYEAQGTNVSIGGTNYDFGPDAKAIVYSSTTLATSTGYVVRLNNNVKDANNSPINGNDPQGGHTVFFSTSGGFFSGGAGITVGNFGSGGSFMPPFALNVMPNSGSVNVARNTKIAVQFDQPMSASSLSSNIELKALSSTFQEGDSVTFTAALSDTDKSLLIITPSSNLAASIRYKVKLLGGLQSSSGVSMAPPGSASTKMFEFEFTTGSLTDSAAPTILAAGLDRFLVGSTYTGVPVSGILKVSFSESIDPTTVNASNVYLRRKGSTSNISGDVKYDIMEGKVLLAPSTALNATTTYILTLTGYIKDLTGAQNALATTTYEFTTGGVDVTGPALSFFNADDYSLSLTFDEPMNSAAITDTNTWPSGSTKWQTSVLNPSNYIVYVDDGAPTTGAFAKYFNVDSLASSSAPSVTLTYDSMFKTIKIKGMQLFAGSSGVSSDSSRRGARVWIKNATDISGNVIQANVGPDAEADNFGSNAAGGPVKNSQSTFGQMGPGGGMFAPPSTAGSFTITDFGGKNPAMMGMMPVGIWPMNMMAGATSTYMMDIPVSSGKAIPASGKIVIGPFPDEANVSLVRDADPNKTFAHRDINGPGTGTVTIASVSVSGQTVTVTLGTTGTQAPDFIHLELDNIKNPTTPTQSGYKVSIQTQKADSTALESFTSMPFFITPKGKYVIIGHVTATDVGLNGVQVFGGSPSTGPLFANSSNSAFGSSTDGEFKIEGLNAGDVMLMTEQSITIGADEYIASFPEPIHLDDSTTNNNSGAAKGGLTGCTSTTACYGYKKITLTRVAAGTTPGLVVYIYGNFATTTGAGYATIDIFAGGQNGFKVKEVSLNGDYSSTPYSTLLSLPNTGSYFVGIGPAMPKTMGKSAPPMPTTWMPPKPVNVNVSGSGGTWTWVESDSASTGTSTADGLVKFTIVSANKTISGHVYDTSGNAVTNAQVFAYSPNGSFGNSTYVGQNGSFSLQVSTGFYKIGAFLPGAPPTNEIGVEVKSSAVLVDGITTTDVILKISKDIQSGYTISGTVYSDTSSQYPASDASVYAYRTDGPGNTETMTDSKGTYTLYVGIGTWKVGVFLPSHGKLTEQTVSVSPSKSGLKFTPDTTTNYVTIRERVWEDQNDDGVVDSGEGIAKATVTFVATSTAYVNTAVTDSSGVYEIKVPATTTYDIYVWSPDIGNLAPQKNTIVTSTNIIYTSFSDYADMRTEKATTVEFGIYDSNNVATTVDKLLIQLDRIGVFGVSNDVYKEKVATTTIRVATSTRPYILDARIEGIPKGLLTFTTFDANTALTTTTVGTKRFATTTVNDYEKIKILLPPVSYVSGQVRDDSGNGISNAVLHIEQPGTDVEFDVDTDSSGNYSFRVASSTTPYLIQANVSGYIDSADSVYASSTSLTYNPSVKKANFTISGQVTINGSAPSGTSVYVWAEKLGGGYGATAKGDPSTGAYTLSITEGSWEVAASAEGYSALTKPVIVDVSGNNVSGIGFDIASEATTQKPQNLSMAGNVGGTVTNKDSGFEMSVPTGTISASDSSSYNVKEKEVSNIPTYTPTGNLVGNTAEEVSAYKMSGSGGNVSTVSGLNGSAFVDKTFTVAQLATEGITTTDQAEEVKMGSYDTSAQNWTMMPTTITYLNNADQPIVPTSTNLSLGISKVVFNGVTKHFSTFGVINSKFDGLAPSAPTGVAVTVSGNQATVSWNAVTTNADGTAAGDLQKYAIYRSSGSSGPWTKITTVPVGTTSYTDTLPSGGTSYYKVTADTGLQSDFSGSSGGVSPSSGGSENIVSTPSSGGGGVSTPPPASPAAPSVPPETPKKIAEAPAAPKAEVKAEKKLTVTFDKPISKMTKAEIQVKIAEILEVINNLKEMIKEVATSVIEGIPSGFKFERTIKPGSASDDVKYIQIILNSDPDTRISGSGAGSPGKETNYFGSITKAALIKFQEKYASKILAPWGLIKGTGTLGNNTRDKLNEIIGK